MRKIYLLSGPGKTEGFSDEILEYLKKDLNNAQSITFIASTPDDYKKNELYVYGNGKEVIGIKNHLSSALNPTTINVIDGRIKSKMGRKIIKDSDAIYLLGGNPEKQLEFLKQKKYDKELQKYKGVILGTSAGAMNVSKIAYCSKDEDYPKSFFYNGIGLVDITIDPHFEISNKVQVEEAIKNSKITKIIGVPNTSAIRISNKKVDYINKCYLFENEKMEEIN